MFQINQYLFWFLKFVGNNINQSNYLVFTLQLDEHLKVII